MGSSGTSLQPSPGRNSHRHDGPLWARVLDSSSSFLGTLVVLPLVVLAFGSVWSWHREFTPSHAQTVRAESAGERRELSPEIEEHTFFSEGAPTFRGENLGPSDAVQFWFERPHRRVTLVLQADGNDAYEVSGSSDGSVFEPLWVVPEWPGDGLRTRTSPVLPVEEGLRSLRVEPRGGDGIYAVSGLTLIENRSFPHVLLIPILWLLWLGLHALHHLRPENVLVARGLDVWRRHDPSIAGLLVFAVVFEVPGSVAVHGLGLAVVVGGLQLLRALARRFGPARAVTALAATAFAVAAFVGVATSMILSRMEYELTVDHRLVPGGEINEDGIRFRGSASSLKKEEHVLIFLGDSFTYGSLVDYEDSYPYVLERMLSELDCAAPVRVANFGWGSSSPLLGYRLLRDIGSKYQPDLVVYNLDMTDFHDDLHYEVELRVNGDEALPKHVLIARLVGSLFPSLSFSREESVLPRPRAAASYFRERSAREVEASVLEESIPRDRFFATNLPLEESRSAMERGVLRNLDRIFRYSLDALDADMLLVILPRAYQYSDQESPENWEAEMYERRGPFVREPFRFFEEAREELPYGVVSLLPAFEASDEFPLYLRDDPHWTVAGNRVAAAELVRYLVDRRLVPCGWSDGDGRTPSDSSR